MKEKKNKKKRRKKRNRKTTKIKQKNKYKNSKIDKEIQKLKIKTIKKMIINNIYNKYITFNNSEWLLLIIRIILHFPTH